MIVWLYDAHTVPYYLVECILLYGLHITQYSLYLVYETYQNLAAGFRRSYAFHSRD